MIHKEIQSIAVLTTYPPALNDLSTLTRRHAKYKHLLRQRIISVECGTKMRAANRGRKSSHAYYRCRVPGKGGDYARKCNQRGHFRVTEVDAAVWGWVRDLFSNEQDASLILTACLVLSPTPPCLPAQAGANNG